MVLNDQKIYTPRLRLLSIFIEPETLQVDDLLLTPSHADEADPFTLDGTDRNATHLTFDLPKIPYNTICIEFHPSEWMM